MPPPQTVYILMMTVGMGFTVTTLAFLPTCLLIVGLQLFYCRRIAIMRRAMFLLEAQKSRHMQERRVWWAREHHPSSTE